MSNQSAEITLITPDWPAPQSVRAVISTRNGGAAVSNVYGANLALHVEDVAQNVIGNRAILSKQTGVSSWCWLRQVHGIDIAKVNAQSANVEFKADGAYTGSKHTACAVLTADCLPILLCNAQGTEVAALHAGWRGLCAGIIQRGVASFKVPPNELIAYLGPAIGPNQFEVGQDVYEAFASSLTPYLKGEIAATGFDLLSLKRYTSECFKLHHLDKNKYLADIYQMARTHLHLLGVRNIYGGAHCTVSEPELFFSYRRERKTGRFVSAIWLSD